MSRLAILVAQSATNVDCLKPGNAPANTTNGAECMFGAFAAATGGQATFTFLVGGSMLLALLMGSDYHPGPVAVGTMLLGGILVPTLPAQYQTTAITIMILGFIVGVWSIADSYFLQVGR